MANAPYEARYGLLGGVSDSVSDESISDNELSAARNYEPDVLGSGALVKRDGVTASIVPATPGFMYSIYDGMNGNYTHVGAKMYNFAGLELDSGLISDYDSWTSFASYDMYVNGTDSKKTSDGTTFTDIVGIPAGTECIAATNNFLYVGGYTSHTGAISWTNVGTITFNAVNELVLESNMGESRFVNMIPWRNALLVLFTKGLYLISHFTTLQPQVFYYTREVGMLQFSRCICVSPAGAFWWSLHGLTWLKPDLSIDYPMKRKLLGTFNAIDNDYHSDNCMVHDPVRKRVMVWVHRSATSTDTIRIDYYYDTDSFFIHNGIATSIRCATNVISGSTSKVYIGFTVGTDDLLYTQEGDTDDGTNITAYLETKCQSSPGVMRRVRNVSVSTNLDTSSDMTYSTYIDGASAATDTYTLSAIGTGKVETVVGVNRACKKIKHRISDASAFRGKILGITEVGEQVRTI